MQRLLLSSLLVSACATHDDDDDDVLGVDLVAPLGEGEARAGVVTQAEALIGGLAGEGQLGDVLLKNRLARFTIQGVRDGGGLADQAGSLIDADVARAPGEPDADLVNDWLVMVDVGHMPRAETITVLDDGVASGRAVVRVEGRESALDYLAGAFEDPSFVGHYGMRFVTDYTLEADSPLLKVETTVTLEGEPRRAEPGDVLMDVAGVGSVWAPGVGRTETLPRETDWLAYVEHEDRVVLGMFAGAPSVGTHPSQALDLLNFLISVSSLFHPAVDLETGGSATWTRYWGVGRDVATLSDAWAAAVDLDVREVTATVTADDGPVAGALVTALVDDLPWTVASSGPDGVVRMKVPATGTVRFVADGVGSRVVDDLPAGAGDDGPLSAAPARARGLASVRDGAPGPAHARGRGRAEAAEGEPLVLGVPATLRLTTPDALPFEARVRRTDAPVVDDALGRPTVDGFAALVYSLDGEVDVPLEPGVYDVLVQRGARWEVHEEEVTLVAGATTVLAADDLVRAYATPGWFTADTHVHAAPSSDGKLSLTDRALTMAGTGVDLWFGTEHDTLADARPLVTALGLDGVLRAVPSVEVSPVARGHANVFPITSDPSLPSGGAWRWWLDPVATTAEHFTRVRATHPGALVQINHPFSPGMPVFAGWTPGYVAKGDYWDDTFDLLEVVHGSRDERNLALYLDLLNRGIVVAPMGNTDAHDFTSNDPGLNVTFIGVGADDVAGITDEALVAALRARRTVASNGPFLALSVPPGSVITENTRLDVTASTPSWMTVDRLVLLKDGVTAETIEGTTGTFMLAGGRDASFVVMAEGDQGMQPLGGHAPFAIASAILLDVDADGWDPPLPPLVIGP